MPQTPEIALLLALIALFGVLVNALVAANNARKRGEIDQKLLEFKAKLDHLNAIDLAKVQAEHSEKLKSLEFDSKNSSEADERRRTADSATLLKILEILDPGNAIAFLREHDFNGTYNRHDSDPVFAFLEFSKRPESEFLDSDLENIRDKLIAIGTALSRLLALKTHPRQSTFNSVLPERYVNEIRPKWVDENAEELNDTASKFVEVYESLIRSARARNGG